MTINTEQPWYYNHDNLVTLTGWLAENYASGDEVAHAVEKVWNYELEFRTAQAGLDRGMLDLLVERIGDEDEDVLFAAITAAGEASNADDEWDFDAWLNEYTEMDETLDEMDERVDGEHVCCLCGRPFSGWGNNPEPIKPYGNPCCDTCNLTKVIPARLGHKW